MRAALAIVLILWTPLVHGFTPTERQKLEQVRKAVKLGIEHGTALQAAAEQARIESASANSSAGSAWASAFATGVTAKKAQAEAERAKKENDRMRPIVDAVSGPWWFPGLNATLYGLKKMSISCGILIVILIIIFVAIGFLVPGARPVLDLVGGWFGRAGKRFLSFFRRRGKTAVDNIRHRTIGTDDDDI